MSFTCQLFGVDRQVYYRNVRRKELRYYQTEEVVSMTLELRKQMPMIGGKKLYHLLYSSLQSEVCITNSRKISVSNELFS